MALAALALVLAPAAAGAATGNGGLGYAPEPAESADGSVISVSPGATVGQPVRLRGSVAGLARGETIEIQRQDRTLGWITAVTATAGTGGSFDVLWTPTVSEVTSLRATAGAGAAIRAANAIPSRRVSIYKSAGATWYGPGLFGNRVACGKRKLTRRLVGVAHRTLPCGTLVEVHYKGRTLTLPVVDRGPFHGAASWDLTYAAARALRFKQTDRLGAVVVKRGRNRATR